MYAVGAVPCNNTAAGFSTNTGKQVAEQVLTYGIGLLNSSILSSKGTFAAAVKGLGGIALEGGSNATRAVLMGK